MDIIRQIIALLIPWKNETAAQKVGTVLTILALVASFAATFFPAVPPAPPPVPSPDVIVPLDVPAADPGAVPGPDVREDVSAPVGILGLLGAAIVSPLGCSAAQVESIKASSADLLTCFANIGAHEATVALEKWGTGYKINAEDLGADALGKALPCLLRFGAVAVSTYVLPAGRWGGSAGEKNVYRGDGYEIVVSPKRK